MADSLVSNLTAASTLTGTELLYADQGGTDVKITVKNVTDRTAIVGWPYTTETANFPETGQDYPWMGFPNPEQVVLAWGQAGDAFPRVCLLSDITDGWYFGDGTFDAYTSSGAPQIAVSGHDLTISAGGSTACVVRLKDGQGVTLHAGTVQLLVDTTQIAFVAPLSKIGTSTSDLVTFYGGTGAPQAAAITAPTGGGTVDSQARTAINAILAVINASTGVGLTA